ncbi:hypothetical protein GGR54DRAFT_88109 [Hypoxylon sp. NC1633]|nr:hypothetical protein GGR54DRAFT_88109 [Hypoxylon sp. NC1633]
MINFFVNWELWQQMTFVLAAAIVVVFMAGLVKLWWLSRFLKKHTVLDLEKRARQMEMQKSGLPAGRRMDIPFGVRAIQSGVEVDGIWISRPCTPIEIGQSSPSFASSSTLEPETKPKGKQRELAVHTRASVTEVEPTPEQSPQPSPAISLSERYIPTSAEPDQVRAFPLGAQPTYRPKGPSHCRTEAIQSENFEVDTLNHLERTMARRQEVETYVPTNSYSGSDSSTSSQQKTMVERSSSSSDEGANHSNLRYVSALRRSTLPTPRTLGPVEDSETSASNVDYFSNIYAEQRRLPFDTPPSVESHSVSRPPLAASKPMPHRTYSGESHANSSSRKVNAGFEVLPAGTFGRPSSQLDMEDGQPRRISNNKLQKKSRDRSSRGASMTR